MNSYVHFHCGRHQLLLNAEQVLAIEDKTTDMDHGELRLWRGRQLPVVNLCHQLNGDSTAGRQQLIVGRSEQDPDACIIDIDLVTALVELMPQQFLPLAPISADLEKLVDAVHVPATNVSRQTWLRLRTPLFKRTLQTAHMEVSA